jgi:hypothetical protein
LSTELIDEGPIFDINLLKITIPMIEDTVSVEFDDPNFCSKTLHLYDEDGVELVANYRQGILYLEHEGNYTYNFVLDISPDIVS